MALVIVLAWQSTGHIGNITYSMILAFCFFFAALAGGVFVLNRPDLIQKLVFPDKELHAEPPSVRPDNLQQNKSGPVRSDFNQENTPEQHKPAQPSAPQYDSTSTTQSEPVRSNNTISSRTVEDIWQAT
jgi:hypothetical protein